MTTKIHNAGNPVRWAEVAEEPQEGWAPATETFLAALIGCAKEQSEKERARESAAKRLAALRADIRGGKDGAEEPAPAGFTAGSGSRPFRLRWTFMQPAIVPSDEAAPAIRCGNTPDTAVEVAVSPRRQESPMILRWTFMRPAIVPSADEVAPAGLCEDSWEGTIEAAKAEDAEIEEMAAAPAPQPRRAMCRRTFARPGFVAPTREDVAVREETVRIEEAAAAPAPVEMLTVMAAAPTTFVQPEITASPATIMQPEITAVPETIVQPEIMAAPETAVQPEITVMRDEEDAAEAAPLILLADDDFESAENREAAEPAALTPAAARAPKQERVQGAASMLARGWAWLNRKYAASATKQLRVAETISLGEKRFVAVVQVEGRKFLIGGGASGVSLLTHLDATQQEAGLGNSLTEERA